MRNQASSLDLTGLNEAQRGAVTHGEGPLLLLAGPGSGKTFTITNRILYLLENGAAPEQLLVITFTKEAALSMQRRFQESCGGKVYPVNFGTFHSCFYQILQKSGAVSAKRIISNSEKVKILIPVLKQFPERNEALSYNQVLRQEMLSCNAIQRHNEAMQCPMGVKYSEISRYHTVFQHNEGPRYHTNPQNNGASQHMARGSWDNLKDDAARLLSAISFYKNTLNYNAALPKLPPLWQPHFEAVMEAYGERVRQEGMIDFDDMLSGCRRLLQENPEAREYWQNRFSHILIDEFQDINPVQYSTVKLLARAPYNIFAVGDDDQAIYGFRGAEPDCLRRFAEEFSARRLLLDINYRSRSEIVGASLAVIGENKNRFEKKLRAAQDGGAADPQGVSCLGFGDREEQYRYLLDALRHVSSPAESRAVLFRTNSYMQAFAARLNREGIPYEIRETAASIYEHFIVKDIMAYLEAACGGAGREHFLRIVNKPSRYVSREAVAECGADIGRLKAYYERGDFSPAHRAAALEGLASLERQLGCMGRLSLHLAVEFCLKAAGYERYLRETAAAREGQWQEWQEMLEWLKGDAAQYSCLKEWKAAQEAYGRALAQGAASRKRISARVGNAEGTGRAGNAKDPGSTGKAAEAGNAGWSGNAREPGSAARANTGMPVQLLTVHGAKGLEFDRVWIPDCNEKVYPHGSLPDAAAVEEERRIFYVAMTRAKKSLGLLYLTGTGERPRQPSRFLNPLACYSCSLSTSSSNSQPSRYSSKASATFSYSSSSSI